MSADLVAFLRARYDDEAQVALMAGDDEKLQAWRVDEGSGVVDGYGANVVYASISRGLFDEAAHIARHDPARVLRDIEAKRRIVDDYERTLAGIPEDERLWNTAEVGFLAGLRTAVELLALPYSDHPDYCEEWKP